MSNPELAALTAIITALSTGTLLRLLDWWLGKTGRGLLVRKGHHDEVAEQQKRIDNLWARNDALEKKVAALQVENESLYVEVRALRIKVTTMTEEFRAQLEQSTEILRAKLLAALEEAQALREQLRILTAEVVALRGLVQQMAKPGEGR
jgi:predicted RNase H-like nuclease (RuvC/YqgF family)